MKDKKDSYEEITIFLLHLRQEITSLRMNVIQSYFPNIHLDWNDGEVKSAFWKSTLFATISTVSMYAVMERCIASKSQHRSQMICYLIPTTFNSLKLMYAVSVWTSTVLHFMRTQQIDFEDKNVNVVLFSVFVQFLVMDTMIGQDYYPNTLKNRLTKNIIQFIIMMAAFTTHQMKWLGFFWLSEYSEVMRYLSLISGCPCDKNDILIYRITHICFQVVYPTFLLTQIYLREYPISDYLWGSLVVSQWFELCQFTFWMIDQMRSVPLKKDVKNE
jgi:hypothetical protein